MIKLCLAALLAVGASAAAAQPAPPPLQPNVDSPAQRHALRELMACLAEQRPRWARRTLARPYLGDAQARDASQALNGRDTCQRGAETELTFRTSSLAGSLAEHFLGGELGRVDPARLVAALNVAEPLNASEDFALCMAARDPAAARALAASDYGSAAEAEAAGRLAAGLELCTNRGETLVVDLQSLRALAAVALYRAVAATN